MQCTKPIDKRLGIQDCLACSGCVEVAAPDRAKHLEGLEAIKRGAGVILTTQSKISMYFRSTWACGTYREFERKLLCFLDNCQVLDSSIGYHILLKRETEKIFAGNPEPLICAMCPGIVAYAENSAHHLLPYLSRAQSAEEVLAAYLKKDWEKVVLVSMCADKRLESEKGKPIVIDYVITTTEMCEMLEGVKDPAPPASYRPSLLGVSQVLPGSSSGGIFEGIVSAMCGEAAAYKVNRENHKEVEVFQKGKIRKIAQIHGLPRVVAFAAQAKDPKYLQDYIYIELMMCKPGCLNGPSQGPIRKPQESEYIRSNGKPDSHLLEEIAALSETTPPRSYAPISPTIKNYAVKW